jgi:hypothetical protein
MLSQWEWPHAFPTMPRGPMPKALGIPRSPQGSESSTWNGVRLVAGHLATVQLCYHTVANRIAVLWPSGIWRISNLSARTPSCCTIIFILPRKHDIGALCHTCSVCDETFGSKHTIMPCRTKRRLPRTYNTPRLWRRPSGPKADCAFQLET